MSQEYNNWIILGKANRFCWLIELAKIEHKRNAPNKFRLVNLFTNYRDNKVEKQKQKKQKVPVVPAPFQ